MTANSRPPDTGLRARRTGGWEPRLVLWIAVGVLAAMGVGLLLTGGRSASTAAWTPLVASGLYESDRGFTLSSPGGWFIAEPPRPDGSDLVAVLSTGETEWQNGADQQLPIIYVLRHAQSNDPETVAASYPRYTWTSELVDGVDMMKSESDPNELSTWGGRIWLVPNGQEVWELRAFIPSGDGYESALEGVKYILDNFSVRSTE